MSKYPDQFPLEHMLLGGPGRAEEMYEIPPAYKMKKHCIVFIEVVFHSTSGHLRPTYVPLLTSSINYRPVVLYTKPGTCVMSVHNSCQALVCQY